VWTIEDVKYDVEAKDVVIVHSVIRFYFKDNLKHICVTILHGTKNTKTC